MPIAENNDLLYGRIHTVLECLAIHIGSGQVFCHLTADFILLGQFLLILLPVCLGFCAFSLEFGNPVG